MERRKFQTCLCFLPFLDPGRDGSTQVPQLHLDYGLEDLQGPFVTQTPWNVGPQHCSLGGTAAHNYCCQCIIVVIAKTDIVLSRCQALFQAHSRINSFIPSTSLIFCR